MVLSLGVPWIGVISVRFGLGGRGACTWGLGPPRPGEGRSIFNQSSEVQAYNLYIPGTTLCRARPRLSVGFLCCFGVR